MMQFEDTEHPLETGAVGLRIWQHKVLFRNLSVATGESQQKVAFEYDAGNNPSDSVSGMWRPIRQGAVKGSFSLESQGAIFRQSKPANYFRQRFRCDWNRKPKP